MKDKCNSKTFCERLIAALDTDKRRPSLDCRMIFNVKRAEPTGKLVILYAGTYGRTGAIVQFCPFCGAKLGRISINMDCPTTEEFVVTEKE